MTHLINQLMSNKGVCRTAPATLGLLNMSVFIKESVLYFCVLSTIFLYFYWYYPLLGKLKS